MVRQVIASSQGTITSDGAGVKLRRIFGHPDVPRFDPFLLLDFYDSRHPDEYIQGFPWHPHRGIETITFLLSGHIEHSDSLGNSGTITDGGCQWMTAGSGIIHQEMVKPVRHLLGMQLWLNLPASDKMIHPGYLEIAAENIPECMAESSRIRIIGGRYHEISGAALRPDIDTCLLDITISGPHAFLIEKDRQDRVFALLMEGSAFFDDRSAQLVQAGSLALYESGPGVPGDILIKAGTEGARFLLVSGKPISEPVAWGGPIVMNTKEELDLAIKEYREGRFIKDPAHLNFWVA
jgi:quercetin 2,3-dioxygenase